MRPELPRRRLRRYWRSVAHRSGSSGWPIAPPIRQGARSSALAPNTRIRGSSSATTVWNRIWKSSSTSRRWQTISFAAQLCASGRLDSSWSVFPEIARSSSPGVCARRLSRDSIGGALFSSSVGIDALCSLLLDHLRGLRQDRRRNGQPRVRAVFRLTTRSSFAGCSIGRSAGLAPLRILST